MLHLRKHNVVFVIACILLSAFALFNAIHTSAASPTRARVWHVADPLYKELLSDTPPGLQKDGAIYWMVTYTPSLLPDFAKEYGLRYSNEEALTELPDYKLLPLMTTDMLDDPFFKQVADKHGIKSLFYPDIRHWTAPGVPVVESAAYMLDPGSKKRFFDDLRDGLKNRRKDIWGVYTSDEMSEYALMHTVRMYWEYRDSYPYIREVNEQVKNRFGFGKYGIPESANDENPYRWIAVRRWVNKAVTDWQKVVYEMVRQMAPEIKVVSIDPVCAHKPIAWDRMAPYFDIATQQLFPPINPDRQQFGFTTKMVADLTGKPTWPCTHVENYPFSTTLEEVRELMSQVMRNGGKGFHFWLKDEIGNNAANGYTMATKWGFPERWRALVAINRLNATMNEVAIPTDPDFAILYSEDHYQAFSNKVVSYPYFFPNEPEWAYTFFGPVARGWFKFINDNMIEDGKTDLSEFNAVIVPAARYERGVVSDALVEYVQAGGTLVIGDPQAFTNDVNGDTLDAVRAKLIGTCTPGGEQKTMTFTADCSMKTLRNRTLAVTSQAFLATPPAGAEIMARFPDGSPAVYRTSVGKGRVIVFACNPFTENAISDTNWKSFFTALSKELGLKTNRDIWRFEFPPYKTVYQPEPKGVCLTGNYIKWWQDKPVDTLNAEIPGTYTFSLQPDSIADRGDSAIPFTVGKLTDRKRAYPTLKSQLKAEDFVVAWKTEQPVDITFDLKDQQAVTRLNLWYADQLPGFTVDGSSDGKSWTRLADHAGIPSPLLSIPKSSDVFDVSVRLSKSKKVRFLRLSFKKRDPGVPMTLAECEIWGSAP